MTKSHLNAFRLKAHNPAYNDPQYLLTPNPEYKKLGDGGRKWQIKAANKGKNARFFFMSAFCGSGKSLLQIWLAIHDAIRSKKRQKQLIVVPQRHIGAGFVVDEEYAYIPIEVNGKKYTWKVGSNNFCDPNNKDVLARLKSWLLSPAIIPKHVDPQIITGLNAVASHQALGLVWNQLSERDRKLAVRNLTLRGDEAHRIKGVFDNNENGLSPEEKALIEQESTILGDICRYMLNSNVKSSKIHLTTATPFRGDRGIILSESARKKFVTYMLDFIEHWKTLGIKDFDMRYEEYLSDPIDQVVANIKKEPNNQHLVIIPSSSHKWRPNGDHELQELLEAIYKAVPKEKVLDLVTPNTQDKNKEKLLAEPKSASKGKSKFNVIVTCMLGREGTDWCPCDRIHNTACENSVTLAVQTIGRLFRRFEGKENIKTIYYVKKFVKPRKGLTKRELLSDRSNCLLTVMQMDEMFHPLFGCPEIPKEKAEQNKERVKKDKQISLAEVFGDQYQKVKQELIEESESLRLSGEDFGKGLSRIINRVIDEHGITRDKEQVQDLLKTLILRIWVRDDIRPMLDIQFLREQGFDKIVEQHVDKKSVYFGTFTNESLQTIRGIMGKYDFLAYKEAQHIYQTVWQSLDEKTACKKDGSLDMQKILRLPKVKKLLKNAI